MADLQSGHASPLAVSTEAQSAQVHTCPHGSSATERAAVLQIEHEHVSR